VAAGYEQGGSLGKRVPLEKKAGWVSMKKRILALWMGDWACMVAWNLGWAIGVQ